MRWLRPQQPGRRSSGASRAVCALSLSTAATAAVSQSLLDPGLVWRGVSVCRGKTKCTRQLALPWPALVASTPSASAYTAVCIQYSATVVTVTQPARKLQTRRSEREREPASPGRAAVLTQHPHGRCHYLSFILPGPGARQRCNYTALAPPPYQTQSSPPDQAEPPAARFLKAHTRTAQSEAACFGGSGCVFWRACCAGASGRLWTDL
jgi:hypothetical protein